MTEAGKKAPRFKLGDPSLYRPTYKEREKMKSDEAERREKQRKNKESMIVSLQNFFNREEVCRLIEYFNECPGTTTKWPGYTYDFGRLSEEAKKFLYNEINGRRIIELGNKGYYSDYHFENVFKSKSYEGCDPQYNVDGLTFLLKQQDESAIITSFGVLEDGVLYMIGCDRIHNLLSKYTAELGRQIYRVTPKRGITIHGLEYSYDLIKAGFEEDPNAPADLRNMDWGKIGILRKK